MREALMFWLGGVLDTDTKGCPMDEVESMVLEWLKATPPGAEGLVSNIQQAADYGQIEAAVVMMYDLCECIMYVVAAMT